MVNENISERWIVNRIGLINFWYYDEEEFEFADGRLLLRGSNGSGKSVTMQSFIPLLLDGNKSPERLDPFGSRARKLENYLLGEDDNQKEENTGYLYMEFAKKELGIFMSIGIGLRAKKGRNMDFWGFSITDGRRIGRDFLLYKEMGEKIPLTKAELKNRIGTGGEVHDSQSDYMDMVNRLLFGFADQEEYDELIKLLVQIRTPKLSKDFKPTVLYEIMNNSLQPLSDEDLRPMSEAIENMDNIKDQLDVLKESKKASDKLMNEYNRYNRFVLLEKAKDFIAYNDVLENMKKDIRLLKNTEEEYKVAYQKEEALNTELKSSQKALEHKRQQLEQHDGFKAIKEIDRLEKLLADLYKGKETKEKNLDIKRDREKHLYNEIKSAKDTKDTYEGKIDSLLGEMGDLAEDFAYFPHGYFAKELMENQDKEYNFSLYRKELDTYRKKIEDARKMLELEKSKSIEYDKAVEELENARKEKENSKRELEKAEAAFDESKSSMVERAYSWEKNNIHLKVPHEQMTRVTRAINNYGLEGSYDDIISEVSEAHKLLENKHNEEIAVLKTKRANIILEKDEKKKELDNWKNQKDPEPKRDDKVVINRKKLSENNIPYLPLYMAVDFNDDVDKKLRGRLEEALIDMGLLDALIINPKHKDKILIGSPETGDKYIFPNPQFFKQDLSMLLKAVVPKESDITFENIDDVLKSILLHDDKSGPYITEKGEYSVGILKGKTSCEYTPKFLGVEARKQYRLENIQRIEKEIQLLNEEIEKHDNDIKEIELLKEVLRKEFKAFPDKGEIEEAYSLVKTCELKLKSREDDVKKREEAGDHIYKELKEIREKIFEITIKLEIPRKLEDFIQAESDIGSYRDMLGDLETWHIKLVQISIKILSLENQTEEIKIDIDNIYIDLRILDRDIKDGEEQKKNFEGLLKELNYEEILHEIDECIKGLNDIPLKLENAIRNAQNYKNGYETAEKKLVEFESQLGLSQKLYDVYRDGFMKEYDLSYVVQFEEEKDYIKIAKKVLGELRSEEKAGKIREDYAKSLQEKYHENNYRLSEYNLRVEYIFDDFEPHDDKRIEKALITRKRLELSARIHGRDVNFNTLSEFINDSIAENEKLLKESDRQLFEDILANTVGKKIKARIYHSEQWVRDMNSLMESMNTSSGLSFSLVWKSRVAESDEQIDTKELVDLLKTDAQLLSEEKMDRLASHFRSKIAQARKELEDKGSAQTFHSIMRDILDYRRWFEFQLYFKKTNETRKELTNNAFYKFSGGEKAMAMYVPLFSSVYARYQSARKDCPRMISLDEAFAGVDENNIRDMFRLIEELKIDYMMNSQILWGDYDTIPALSICELIRPNNADFVTVIRYRWNGFIRELVS